MENHHADNMPVETGRSLADDDAALQAILDDERAAFDAGQLDDDLSD